MIELEKLRAHNDLILQHAERIYRLLWQEMNRWIEEAQERGIKVETNGSPLERSVVLPSQLASDLPRILTISLKKELHVISVSGLQHPLELQLDVCPDNVVCLKHNGVEVNIDKAAILILDPFLFPELTRSGSTLP